MSTTERHHHHDHGAHAHHHAPAEGGTLDPVCGMTVDPHTAKHRAEHQGSSPIISARPAAAPSSSPTPQKYLGDKADAPAEPVPEGTIYTCPMHPEIRQVGPGSCPICGMALEPELPSADTGPNPELVDMTRRFWIGLVLTLPVFVLEMGAHLVGAHGWVEPKLSTYIQFAFATPVVLWAGWPFFVRGWQSLAHAQPQHVHADRHGHRRGLPLQRRRDFRARHFPARVPRARRRRRRSISKPPPSSPCWCCSARCWNCARARRPPARSRRCSIWRRRPRAASRTTAATRKFRSMRFKSATDCACARATRCRSTASCWKAAPRSMNRW